MSTDLLRKWNDSLRLRLINRNQQWTSLIWSASGNFWDSRLGKILRHGIHGMLLVLIGITLNSMIPKNFLIKQSTNQIRALDKQNVRKQPIDLVDSIVSAHLFGKPHAKHVMSNALIGSAITVDGIAYASNSADSIAILTMKGKTGEYHEGELLPNGEKLTAINPGAIQVSLDASPRNIAMAHYGTPDSEGPAAYLAMLHGVGFLSPTPNGPGAAQHANMGIWAETGSESRLGQAAQLIPLPSNSGAPSATIVNLPAGTTPLEQLRILRAKLIN